MTSRGVAAASRGIPGWESCHDSVGIPQQRYLTGACQRCDEGDKARRNEEGATNKQAESRVNQLEERGLQSSRGRKRAADSQCVPGIKRSLREDSEIAERRA